jgi:serine/threonine-protein kinase HipA
MTAVTALDFAIYGHRAGAIRREREKISLTYDPDYLARPDATPLSLSMPLATTSYSARPVLAFLRGLLPDHRAVRERWSRQFGMTSDDVLDLVAAVGSDVAGGAVFARPENLDAALDRPGQVEPMSERQIADRLRTLREDDGAWLGSDEEHWSLPGGQGKFALTATATPGIWGLATGSAPSTHIVKPGIGRIRAQALAEHLTMRALAANGLDVAQTDYVLFEDQPAIVVTRYDRVQAADGTVVRLHQEDMVQTFALDPGRKYEAEGGPGVAKIVSRLRDATAPSSVDAFVDATIAGALLGAPDGHAKNYSMLLVRRNARLAPLYDVSTGLIPSASGRLRYGAAAMSIGGEKRFGDIEGKHWDRFARVVGRDPEQVRERVRDLAAGIPAAFDAAIDHAPATDDVPFLRDVVLRNIEAVSRQKVHGLTASRRTPEGRLVTPFLRTLEPEAVRDDPDDEAWDREGTPART